MKMSFKSFLFHSSAAAMLSVAMLAIVSCNNDVYEKGEGENSQMLADFVDAFTGADAKVSYVVTDSDERLTVTEPFQTKWINRPDTTYRILLYYNKVGQTAEALSAARVSTLIPLKINELEGDMKTDPVKLESWWMAPNKRYLNVGIYVYVGSSGTDAVQEVGAVATDTLTSDTDKRTLCLTLFHNQAGMPEYYSQRTFLSIPTADMDADSLRLTVNTYDGVFTQTFAVGR